MITARRFIPCQVPQNTENRSEILNSAVKFIKEF